MFAKGYTIFSALAVSLSSLLFGYNVSVIDAPGSLFRFCRPGADSLGVFPACFLMSSWQWSLTVSIMCIGALVSALAAGSMIDRWGRKKTLWMNDSIYLAGFILAALSVDFVTLFVSRVLIGLAIGITSVAVPTYLNEISTEENRGMLGSIHQFCIVIGILLGQTAGIGLAKPALWRGLFMIGGGIALLQAVLLAFVVESPKYLKAKGRKEEFMQVEKRIFKAASIEELPTTTLLNRELDACPAKGQSPNGENDEREENLSVLNLVFREPKARKSLLIAVIMHAVQQLSGINAVLYFSTSIFGSLSIAPSVISVMIGCVLLAFTIVSMGCLDRYGRKILLVISAGGMTVASVALSLSMYYGVDGLKIACVLIFIACFALGLGPIPWLIISEIFPTQSVSAASAIGVGVNWTLNFVVGMSFKTISDLLGDWTFMPFAGFTGLFTVWCWMAFDETKGKPIDYA